MKAITKTVMVTVGGKINLGNYNSLQVDQTRWIDIILEEGEDLTIEQVEAVTEEAKDSIRKQLRAWANEKASKPNHAVQVVEKFAGKTVEPELDARLDDYSDVDPKDGMPFGDK